MESKSGIPFMMQYKKSTFSFYMALCVLATLLIPITNLIANNLLDLGAEFIDAVIFSTAASLIFFFVILLISLLLDSKLFRKVVTLVIFSLLIASFISTYFIPNNHPLIDGNLIIEKLETRSSVQFIPIYVCLTLFLPIFLDFKPFSFIRENVSFGTKLIIFITFVLTTYVFISLPELRSGIASQLSENEKIVFGKNNVIILSFDQVQGSAFNGFLQTAGSDFKNDLDGFEFYPNAVTPFPTTNFSLGALFLSRLPESTKDHYFSARNSSTTFFKLATDIGIDTQIYFKARHFGMQMPYFRKYGNPLQSMVHAINNAFGVNLTRLDLHKLRGYSSFHVTNAWKDDSYILSNLADQIELDENKKGSIFFMHFAFSHAPFTVSENCELHAEETFSRLMRSNAGIFKSLIDSHKCIESGVKQVIKKLKSLDIYDNTAIFIIADHGYEQNVNRMFSNSLPDFFPSEYGFVSPKNLKAIGSYNPIVLYKKQNLRSPFVTNDKVVSLLDIAPTISDIYGIKKHESWTGKPLGYSSDLHRSHEFWIYKGGRKPDFLFFIKSDWVKVQAKNLYALKNKLD